MQMNKFIHGFLRRCVRRNPERCARRFTYRILLALGLGMGVLLAPASYCHGSTAGNTSLSFTNLWQFSVPSSRSLLNPGNILGLKKALTSLFLLNWRGEWFFRAGARESGGRFVFEDTVQLYLDHKESDLTNLVNEIYFSLQPTDFFFIDAGKQVTTTGSGYFLNPSDLWSRARERAPFLQDRDLPPEGKVMLKGEYLFPSLTLEVGWAPRLAWAEDDDVILRRCFGNPQRSSPAWVKVSGGFSGVDGSCLLSCDRQWKAGLNLARVFGDNLEVHCEMGWEEWEKAQADKLNHLFLALAGNADESGRHESGNAHAIKATTEKGFLKALAGANYTFAGGANLIIEYLFNGSGLTRKEWEQVFLSISGNASPAAGDANCPPAGDEGNPPGAAGQQKITAFFAETGFPGLHRHYAMARLHQDLSPVLALEQIVIQNLVDWSGLAILGLNYEKKRFVLSFAAQIPYGKQESEFALMTGDWQVKLKVEWVR